MSADTLPARGAWWQAWLAGTATQLFAGLALLAAFAPRMIGAHGVPLESEQYILFIGDFFLPALIAALCTTLLLIGMAALAERRRSRPLPLWLGFGLIAASPLALAAWALATLGARPHVAPVPLTTPYPILLPFYGLGLLGALVAYRIRHGAWHA